MKTIIKNGNVCLENKLIKTDLLIENEKIIAIDNIPSAFKVEQEINAENLYILPGLIDLHVHLDDQIGDFYISDSYKTGTKVALQHGITTICSFITQKPNQTLIEAIKITETKTYNNCYCDLACHLTPITWNKQSWQELYTSFERGFKTLKLYSTYKKAGIYSDYDLIAKILKEIKKYNIRTLIHCEDEEVLQKIKYQDHDLSDPFSHCKLRPEKAEEKAIEKIIAINHKINSPIHIVHVSSAKSAELIFAAKNNIPLSCETAPQYLFLNNGLLKIKNGHRYLCTPPLRDEKNQQLLLAMAKNDYFDIFATDHCPFSKHDKDQNKDNILNIPNGLPGVGALFDLIYHLYRLDSRLRGNDQITHALCSITKHLATNPAKLAGLSNKGTIALNQDADLVIFAPSGIKHPMQATLSDCYDPYSNLASNLDIKYVLLRGKIVVKDNVTITNPMGKCLWQQ